MTFEELARPGRCDVCDTDAPVVVLASSVGPVSFAYCRTCHDKGLEPYYAIVAHFACAGLDINDQYRYQVKDILAELQISEDQFVADVRKFMVELDSYSMEFEDDLEEIEDDE